MSRPKELPHPEVRVFGVPFGELWNQLLLAVLDDEAEEYAKEGLRKAGPNGSKD